ncbi:hypothetical protein HID58_021180 [Brassica napus]|uniref:Uncharacterized protein n=1 Tax=Brassica napus TaxID=3708 RepID=A0ABQ8CVP2_BRANA|nr:hypothetical protein HID58_021180 [Brassica napus]
MSRKREAHLRIKDTASSKGSEAKTKMKALGYWLMVVGSLRLAAVWFGFFNIWALRLAVFSQTTMSEVHGRTFGVWTLLTCTLCFLCAFNPENKPTSSSTYNDRRQSLNRGLLRRYGLWKSPDITSPTLARRLCGCSGSGIPLNNRTPNFLDFFFFFSRRHGIQRLCRSLNLYTHLISRVENAFSCRIDYIDSGKIHALIFPPKNSNASKPKSRQYYT